MSSIRPAPTRTRRPGSPAAPSSAAVPTTGITAYGCDRDEAAMIRQVAPRLGVLATVTDAPVSEANVDLAVGNRCISIGHRTHVADSTLRALGRAGVEYISTRSIGCNHIDVRYAESLGILVGNVAYSPDSVADFTLMAMLMVVRHAKSVIRHVDVHDYRLGEVRARELRDLTVGVVGTGRIGTAVIDRLRAFGSRILAHDNRAVVGVDRVPLDELVRRSDIVTLHTPLDADTHHLLDGRRIEQLKPGAFVVNTGRGALLDTEALLRALERGRLGGAALDVLEGEDGIFYTDRRGEPVRNETLLRLQRLPNVLLTPHTAYYTDHALADAVENSLLDCLDFEDGSRHG